MSTAFTAATLVAGTIPAFAEDLHFEDPQQRFAASLDQNAQPVEFHFQNTSSTVVIIGAIDVGCHCMVANLEKREYRPGESGTISVLYTFGDSIGNERKKIAVHARRYDTGAETIASLELSVSIPTALIEGVKSVVYQMDAPASHQFLDFHVKEGTTVRNLSIMDADQDPLIQVQQSVSPDEKTLHVDFYPTTTDRKTVNPKGRNSLIKRYHISYRTVPGNALRQQRINVIFR